MSQHATELCHLLVDDMYGDITSAIFGALKDFGRLALPAIAQHTKFSPRQVKHSLAVLIQQTLAFWYLSQDDNTIYYEANLVNAYAIVQLGKHVSLVEHRLGKAPASVASALLLSGHARMEDLKQAYDESEEAATALKTQKAVSKPNGRPVHSILKTGESSHGTSTENFDSALQKLLGARYVAVLHESHLRSPADNRREAEQLVRSRSLIDGPLKGPDKVEFENSVKELLVEWEYGTEEGIKMMEDKLVASATSRSKKKVVKRGKIEDEGEEPVARKKRRIVTKKEAIAQIEDIGEPFPARTNGNEENGIVHVENGEANDTRTTTKLNEQTSPVNEQQHIDIQSEEPADQTIINANSNEQSETFHNDAADQKEESNEVMVASREHTPQRALPKADELKSPTHLASSGKKRAAPNDANGWHEEQVTKKKRMENGSSQVVELLEEKNEQANENAQTVLRVDLDKLTVATRNESLVLEAERSIGTATSAVYSKLLRRTEKDVLTCRISRSEEDEIEDDDFVPHSSPSILTREVLEELKDIENLGEGIAEVDPAKVNLSESLHRKRKRRRGEDSDESEVEGGNSSEDQAAEHEAEEAENEAGGGGEEGNEERNPKADHENQDTGNAGPDAETQTHALSRTRLEQARQHLFLLSQHNPPFLIHHRRKINRPEYWSVPYATLLPTLRLSALFSTIASRYGKPAHRLARILHEKGKLDEKSLTSHSLLNQKAMRSALAAMHAAGFLELQEIPRDNNRQPSRTLFLWFFDAKRCALQATDGAYLAMSRALQRLRVEREAVRGVLGKAERSDVEGREAEFLTAGELATLEKWKAVEARIWGELARLDDFVCLLRDY